LIVFIKRSVTFLFETKKRVFNVFFYFLCERFSFYIYDEAYATWQLQHIHSKELIAGTYSCKLVKFEQETRDNVLYSLHTSLQLITDDNS
jgi:hypothetical protein